MFDTKVVQECMHLWGELGIETRVDEEISIIFLDEIADAEV